MITISTNNQKINGKVLLQLSGGKDSVACMLLLSQAKISFEAIHFTHRYGYKLPSQQCKELCQQYGIKLNVVDVTDQLEAMLLNEFNHRPCRYCKSIMDQLTVDYAQNNMFNYICVGDTGDDTMLINRIIDHDGIVLEMSRYFNSSVKLPENINIFRPLLNYKGSEILDYVLTSIPNFKRVNDTGDKYFEYSREGCPLQYKDYGIKYTTELLKQLQLYNTLCAKFATENGIRASIHLPSGFIVTIPKGYEEKCREFLLDNGCDLRNTNSFNYCAYHYTIIIRYPKNLFFSNANKSNVFDSEILEEMFLRFIERLGERRGNLIHIFDGCSCISENYYATAIWSEKFESITLTIMSQNMYNDDLLNNICIEIFHTNNYKISSVKI